MIKKCVTIALTAVILQGCAVTKNTAPHTASSLNVLLTDSALLNAHTGVYVYDPATATALYSYQSDKYFVPASNTKLFTCYAGIKYLGDSLPGMRIDTTGIAWNCMPTGDPTFLHPDFTNQPVLELFKRTNKAILLEASAIDNQWKAHALGKGWSWDDYNYSYMTERSVMPIYGNVVSFTPGKQSTVLTSQKTFSAYPSAFLNKLEVNAPATFGNRFEIERKLSENKFSLKKAANNFTAQIIPFATSIYTTASLLNDTLYKYEYQRRVKQDSMQQVIAIRENRDYVPKIHPQLSADSFRKIMVPYAIINGTNQQSEIVHQKFITIHSQPTDSLLKPMMHNSDNFYAEQTLLMVSNEKLGYMSDRAIIDTLLSTNLKDLPQKPIWVDGSGLSRYNLFTPQSFVKILEKMKDEFGMERMKNILPTGGEGTLGSLYKPIANQIFAKTGTLSGQVALSGYLYTKSNILLLFSILVNNHNSTATNVRKAVEKFVLDIWEKN